MVRVLQVFGILNRGGAETMIMNYYREMDREAIQFDFAVNFQQQGAYEPEIESLGGRIFRLPRFKGYNLITFLWAWFTLLRKHREWEVIHVHNFKVAGLIFLAARFAGARKKIVHMHTSNPTYSTSRRLGYTITKALANRHATHRIACSAEAGECYFGSRDFKVLRNAIDLNRFNFSEDVATKHREEFGFSAENFVVGHVGNFSKVKNHRFIVDVFCEVAKQSSEARLLLVGSGALLEETKRLVRERGIEDLVVFAGSRGDVNELLMAMDILLFPSEFEGLPVTIIEAQASGLRVVMSDVITREVIVTELVETLPLSLSATQWAERLLAHSERYGREQDSKSISKAGYNIADNIEELKSLYLK